MNINLMYIIQWLLLQLIMFTTNVHSLVHGHSIHITLINSKKKNWPPARKKTTSQDKYNLQKIKCQENYRIITTMELYSFPQIIEQIIRKNIIFFFASFVLRNNAKIYFYILMIVNTLSRKVSNVKNGPALIKRPGAENHFFTYDNLKLQRPHYILDTSFVSSHTLK